MTTVSMTSTFHTNTSDLKKKENMAPTDGPADQLLHADAETQKRKIEIKEKEKQRKFFWWKDEKFADREREEESF